MLLFDFNLLAKDYEFPSFWSFFAILRVEDKVYTLSNFDFKVLSSSLVLN